MVFRVARLRGCEVPRFRGCRFRGCEVRGSEVATRLRGAEVGDRAPATSQPRNPATQQPNPATLPPTHSGLYVVMSWVALLVTATKPQPRLLYFIVTLMRTRPLGKEPWVKAKALRMSPIWPKTARAGVSTPGGFAAGGGSWRVVEAIRESSVIE